VSPLEVTIEQVRRARGRIDAHVHRTPVLTCASLDAACGLTLFLKAENLQRGGSFKVRGATNALLCLDPQRRARGVVAYSSGNHAQGVALAARAAGVPATVVMPETAPRAKRAAVEQYGAEVVSYDPERESREEIARELARESGRPLVPPFDHPEIIAGQGTATLELLEEVEGLDALVIPVGGGGLLSGACVVARALRPSLRLIGVEPRLAPTATRALESGGPVTVEPGATLFDGLRPLHVGEHTYAIMSEAVEAMVLVEEEDVAPALRLLLMRAKTLAEPSGAAALAALLARRLELPARSRVGVILSGGNVDPEVLADLLRT
jgi:threonine dehydratase